MFCTEKGITHGARVNEQTYHKFDDSLKLCCVLHGLWHEKEIILDDCVWITLTHFHQRDRGIHLFVDILDIGVQWRPCIIRSRDLRKLHKTRFHSLCIDR